MRGGKIRSLIPILAPPAVLGFLLLLSPLKVVQQLENVTIDWRFQARASSDPPVDERILVVGIGEYALNPERFGRWPWPRDRHAVLLQLLSLRPPKVIAFDLLFTEPSQDESLDIAFADQLAVHPGAITGASADEGVVQDRIFVKNQIGKTEPITRIIGDIRDLEGEDGGLLPVEVIAESGWTGFVNSEPSAIDGVRRRMPMVVRLGDKVFPSLVLQALLKYHDLRADAVEVTLGDALRIEKDSEIIEEIPIDSSGQMRINYRAFSEGTGYRSPDYFELIESLAAFNESREWPAANPPVEGQILIIGQTAAGLTDFGPTPHNKKAPLVEVQANALNNILRHDFLSEAPRWPIYLGWLILAWATLWLLRKSGLIVGLIVPLLMVVAYITCAYLLFRFQSLELPLFVPVFGFVAVHGSALIDRLWVEIQAKSRIKNMFGTYVSPDVVDQMVESEEDPKLGGENCEITAFFSDIQSFSAFSELLSAQQLVSLLNEYLTPMTEILWYNHGGTLDKYIGDAIVGMFGAPLPYEDHAHRGCLAAIEMQAKQAELREKWRKDGGWPEIVHHMQTRIGLNSGEVVIGNMGSPRRFNFTMMGDNVNLAARCESGAKKYGVYTMVTEDTQRRAVETKDDIAFRYLDQIVVQGRSQPVKMFEVLGLTAELPGEAAECIELFSKGMEKYLAQDWDQALALFLKASKLEPNQPGGELGIVTNPSMVMIERVPEMKVSAPGDDWDGVFVMTTK